MNYPPNTIEYDQDSLGREHIELEGYSFTIVKRTPFREWLTRGYNADDFNKLTIEEKRTIFLRWKWGLQSKLTTHDGKTKFNDDGNYSAEYSRRDDMRIVDALINSAKNTGLRWYWENTKQDEDYCFSVARDIGLIPERNPQMDKIVKMFNPEVKYGLSE